MVDIWGQVGQSNIASNFLQGVEMGENRKLRQQQATMLAQQFESQQKQANMSNSMQEMQMQQMQLELKKLQNEANRKEAFSTFDAYEATGDISYLNRALQNPTLKRLSNGAVRYEKPTQEDIDNMPPELKRKYSIAPSNIIMTINDRGERMYSDLAGAYKSTGYYKHMSTEALNNFKLKNELIHEKGLHDSWLAYKQQNPEATYTDWQDFRKQQALSPSEKSAALDYQIEVKNQAMMSFMDTQSGKYSDALDNPDTPVKIAAGIEVSPYELARARQGKAQLSGTKRDMIDGLYATGAAIPKLYENMQADDFDWDALSKFMGEVQAVSPEDWKVMPEDEKQAFLNKFEFNAELQTIVAGYIKAMSGAAVTDDERRFYMDNITKGNWSNKESALASMRGFQNGVKQQYDTALLGLKSAYPVDYLNYKTMGNLEYIKGTTRHTPATPVKNEPSFMEKAGAAFNKAKDAVGLGKKPEATSLQIGSPLTIGEDKAEVIEVLEDGSYRVKRLSDGKTGIYKPKG